MGTIIDCKSIAKKLKDEIKNKTSYLKDKKAINLKVASILVNDDPGSIYYQNSQEKLAKELGIEFNKIILPKDINQVELEKVINNLNNDSTIKGIMVLLPLPKGIDEKYITNIISPLKDIDCLSDISIGRFYKGEDSFIPCTPNSILTILKNIDVILEGKNIVVVGRSSIVGKPVAELLLRENATVTICHSKTKNLKAICKTADILIVAIGRPNFIKKDYINKNSIVIDVGTSSLNGKITGDVDFSDVLDKVRYITKVPGGVGTLTTTLLLKNVCRCVDYED